MRTVRVVVLDVLGEPGLQMAAAEDEHPVEALAPQRADHALTDRARPGCSVRAREGPYFVCGQDGVEGSRELGVAISDVELHRVRALGEVHREIAGLGHRVGERVFRDAGDADEARVVVDDTST